MSIDSSSIHNYDKAVIKTIAPKDKHWVGNGFHVNTMFSIQTEDYFHLSPFIMMDYAAPRFFEPSLTKRESAHTHIEALRQLHSLCKAPSITEILPGVEVA